MFRVLWWAPHTETLARGGCYCTLHRRWSFNGLDFEVPAEWAYASAETVLAEDLWTRGITLHTGELHLAAALCRAAIGEDPSSPIRARACEAGTPETRTFAEVLMFGYPEVVKVASLIKIAHRRFFQNWMMPVHTLARY